MKLFKLVLPLLAAASLTGCNGGTTLIQYGVVQATAVSKTTSTSISYKCGKCDGTFVYSFNVKKGTSLFIHADIDVELGAITIDLNEGTKTVFHDIIIDDFEYDIPIKEYGRHKMTLKIDDFSGSFNFYWGKK